MVKVSTVIPTYNRAELLLTRSLPSVLAQTDPELEVIVVGDGTDDETVDRMAAVDDPRVQFINLPRPEYPADPVGFWRVAGMGAVNAGLELATGEWVCILADDDELEPQHHEALLAESSGAELVWGQSTVWVDGRRLIDRLYGNQQQLETHDVCMGAFILRAEFGHRAVPPTGDRSWDAEWWARLLERNVGRRRIERTVHRYHPNRETWQYHGFSYA